MCGFSANGSSWSEAIRSASAGDVPLVAAVRGRGGVGALTTILAQRIATLIYVKVYGEDPPE